MRYLVTGATGFIGSWVVKQLVDKKQEVRCLIRKTSNLKWLKDLPVEYHYGSLLNLDKVKVAISDADCVLHIAGVTKALSMEDYYFGNVEATRNLMEAIFMVNPDLQKVVYVSSQAAVGPSRRGIPVDEKSPMRPITDYGSSKMQGEAIVRHYMDKLPITILRPPTVYGPRDTDVLEVFKNVQKRINLRIRKIDPVVSIIHVYDLARGIIMASEDEESNGETYFIANDNPCNWSDVIEILKKVMNKKALNLSMPYSVSYMYAWLMEYVSRISGKPTIINRQKIREVNAGYWELSNKKIKADLGFTSQLNLEEGLRNTYEWYKNENWLK